MNYKNIPIELKQINRWVGYKLVQRKDSNKYDKIPKNPHTGGNASTSNPNTWASFEVAHQAMGAYGFDGLGVVLGDGLMGVDIDGIDINDSIVHEVISTLNSYAEISPSGKGIHVIGYGKKPYGQCRKGNFEVYDKGRFFTVTGNVLEGYSTVTDCTESIKPLYDKYLAYQVNKINSTTQTDLCLVEQLDDSEVIEKASKNTLFNDLYFYGCGCGDPSRDDMTLINILIFWTGGNFEQIDRLFRASALMRDKWNRRQSGSTYGELTINKCIRTYRGNYYNANYYKR